MWRERLAALLGAVLQGVSWLLLTIGVLGFWCADRALHDIAHMSWGLAELVGTGASVICLIVGFALRTLRDS